MQVAREGVSDKSAFYQLTTAVHRSDIFFGDKLYFVVQFNIVLILSVKSLTLMYSYSFSFNSFSSNFYHN